MFYSQIGQDEQVLKYFNNKTDGFFVEVGAWNGINLSNTFALENLGWTGICVEPIPERFKELSANRKCKKFQVALDFESDKTLEFVLSGMLSGDLSRLDTARVSKKAGGLSNIISVKTMNFTELLDSADAPCLMDYLSIDTEGTEFDILRGLDYNKYNFRYITVEHNYKEPARTNIKNLLESKKYTLYRKNRHDDDYIFNSEHHA